MSADWLSQHLTMLPNPFNTSAERDTMKSVHIYPVIARGYGVFIQPEKGYFFSYKENKKEDTRLETLNVQACAILEQCTGFNTVKDIVDILTDQFEDTPPDLLLQVTSFLDETAEKGYLVFSDHPEAQHGIIQGSITYYTPQEILTEITTGCNLNCSHCLISAGKPLKDELTASQFIPILIRLSEMGTRRMNMTGGEILTKEGWGQLVDFCTTRFHLSILTNGTAMTKEAVEKLKDCRETYVSIYGARPETHDSITRVEGSFKKAVNGIKLLAEKTSVGMSIIIMPSNLSEVGDMVKLASSLGCKVVRMGFICPMGRAVQGQWELTSPQKVLLDKKVRELQEEYKGIVRILWEKEPSGDYRCGAGFIRWLVTSNGEVYPCTVFRIYMGNLVEDDILDICTSQAVKFLARVNVPHQALCGECPLLHTCRNCHGQAYAHYQQVDHCMWAEQFREAPEPLRSAFFKKKIESKRKKKM
jgi:radical SAM protein with 4Fe4S-binding SPASM domain